MKNTLYQKLMNQYKEIGFKVEPGNWVEKVGYKKPTTEYWFDVIQDNGNKRYTTHFWFKDTLNKLQGMELFVSDLVLEEKNVTRLV